MLTEKSSQQHLKYQPVHLCVFPYFSPREQVNAPQHKRERLLNTILGLLQCSLIDQSAGDACQASSHSPASRRLPSAMGTAKVNEQRSRTAGSHDGPAWTWKLKALISDTAWKVFFFHCIICMSTEKTYTLLLASKYTTHSACSAPFPWEKEWESEGEKESRRGWWPWPGL